MDAAVAALGLDETEAATLRAQMKLMDSALREELRALHDQELDIYVG